VTSLERAPRSLGWLLAGSVVLHVVVMRAMPRPAPRVHTVVLPPVELMDVPPPLPPPPPPEPTPEEPARAPAPVAAAPTRSAARTAQDSKPAPPDAPPEPKLSDDGPIDFTATPMALAGTGVAVRAPSGGGGGTGPAAGPPSRPRPSAEVVVPVASLSRPPRAPGLDAVLERNYPVEARRAGISGKAVLRVRILHDGRVTSVVTLSESSGGFGAACERTVRAAPWEAPIDREGRAVATEITYVCQFEVRS